MSYKLFTFIVYFTFFTYHNNIQTQNISFDAIKKPLFYVCGGLGAVALAASVLVIYLRKTKSKNNQDKGNNSNSSSSNKINNTKSKNNQSKGNNRNSSNSNKINNNDRMILEVEKDRYNEGEIANNLFTIGKRLLEDNNKQIVGPYNKAVETIFLQCSNIVLLINNIKQEIVGKFIPEMTFDKLYQANFEQYPFDHNDRALLKDNFNKECGFLLKGIENKLNFFLYYFSYPCLGEKVKHTLLKKFKNIHKTIALKIRHNYKDLKNIFKHISTQIDFAAMRMTEKEKNIFEGNILKENAQEIKELIEKFPVKVANDLKNKLINSENNTVLLEETVNNNLEAIYNDEFKQELNNITKETESFLDENKKIKNVLREGDINNFEEITVKGLINLIIFEGIKDKAKFVLEKLHHNVSQKLYEKFELNVNMLLKAHNTNKEIENQKEIIIDDNNQEHKTIILYQVDWANIAENSEIFGNFKRFLLLEDLHISKEFDNDYNRIICLKMFYYLKHMPQDIYTKHFENNVELFFKKNPCIFTQWFLNLGYAYKWKGYEDTLLITLCGKYQNKLFENVINNYIDQYTEQIYQNYYSYSCSGNVFEFYTQKRLYKDTDIQSILYDKIFHKDEAKSKQNVLNNENNIKIEQNISIIDKKKDQGQEIIEIFSYREIEKLKSYFTLPKIYYKQHMGCGCCSLNALESILNDMLWKEDDNYREWCAKNKK